MPLTLIDVVAKRWLLSDNEILCKLVHASGATSVFVSTISITTIAVDRYQVKMESFVERNSRIEYF